MPPLQQKVFRKGKKTRRKRPSSQSRLVARNLFLGIEGGATRTTALLLDEKGHFIGRAEGGPCNLRLISDDKIVHIWKELHRKSSAGMSSTAAPSSVGAFVAGCRTTADQERLKRLVKRAWPGARATVGDDSQSAMAAALGNADGVMLICGTGSIVRAKKGGRTAQVGGWGHVGGDGGSGYWMGRELLRTIFRKADEKEKTHAHPLGQAVLSFLMLATLEDLVQWSLEASKAEIASLTPVLFRFPTNTLAKKILNDAVRQLRDEVDLAARQIGLRAPQVVLNQGIAMHQPRFAKMLSRAIRKKIRGAKVFVSRAEGALGAALLARGTNPFLPEKMAKQKDPLPVGRRLDQALTEQRNPRTMDLHRRNIPMLVKTMLDEESRTIPAIRPHAAVISKVASWITDSLKSGGHLFYIGAGTSGRLGVLDAAECPPTFGSDPEQVQGIIAGGMKALYRSVESAEDESEIGCQSMQDRGIGPKDVVIGITASGSTPFVLGALQEAHAREAKTVLLTFNPRAEFRLSGKKFIRLEIATGPEVLAGSTRLKAGTATKLILNMWTTIAMIRLGKVQSNLMINLEPTCEKLHDRAARIYSELRHVPLDQAAGILEQNQWELRKLLKK